MAKIYLLLCALLFAGFFQASGQRVPVEKLKILPPKSGIKTNARASGVKSTNPIARMDIAPGCDSIFLGSQADIDNFSANHPDCDSIRILIIDGLNASPAITNVGGLNSIVAVTQHLIIRNTSIVSLSGFSNLSYVGGTFHLQDDILLQNTGINNLEHIGRVFFKNVPSLTDVSGLANNIASIGSIVIDTCGLTNLNGFGNITTITEFEGVTIGATPLLSLSDLTSLTTVSGYIKLDNLPVMTHIGLTALEQTYGFLFGGIPNLTSIAGISDHLTNTGIGTFWMINTGLTDLTGMDRVTSAANFYIWFNPNLTSLHGLESLSGNIGGGVYISGNDNLTDISAVSNITGINDGSLELNSNGSLVDASALHNITNIGGALSIRDNPLLTSLNFLNNSLSIENNYDDEVRITGNSQLAVCSLTPICNYLALGKPATIENNAGGCNSIAEVTAACANCTGGTLKVWTGNENSDWNNPNNWEDGIVPGNCDTVKIPQGIYNHPEANSNITIHGLIMEWNAELNLQDYNLISTGVLSLANAQINSYSNNNTITFKDATDPHIEYSNISVPTINIIGYKGLLEIYYNTFYGNVTLSDDESRDGSNIIYGNSFNGNLSLTTNSPNPGAVTQLSQGGDDFISGNFSLTINAPVNFWFGINNYVRLDGDFIFQSDVDPELLYFGNLIFVDGTWSHIRQNGTTPIRLRYVRMEKYFGARVTLDQPVYILNDLRLSTGIIKTTNDNLLIFTDDAAVGQTSSASWISGPVKKIGNEQFTFPIGDDQRQAIVTILAPPSSTDAYTAQYFYANPSLNGYDTSMHESSLTKISGKEYWTIKKDPGSSDVLIGLSYDSTRSYKTSSLYSLRTTQWDGTKWLNKGSIFLSGNLAEAYLTSGVFINDYDHPMSLGYIEPPIIPVITMGPMDTVACRGSNFKVRYTLDTLMFSGNDFTIQLSDSSGSFANPQTLATLIDKTSSDSVTIFIPTNIKLSELYRVRIIGNSPPDTSVNTWPLAIRATPSLAFTIQGPQPGCIGNGIHKYYVSQKEPGVIYDWSLNGGGTYTVDRDTIFVTWTAPGSYFLSVSTSNVCGNGPSANKQVTVGNPKPTAAPTLNKTGRWLYASSPDASQNSLGFHWYRNDTLIAGASSATYYASIGGTYKVSYYNICGDGPSSTLFVYAENAITQSISFPTINTKTYGDSAFAINTNASSGFPVSLSIISGPGTLTGNIYTITTTGTVTIKATQSGDDIYDTAAYVMQTFVINKAAQTITFPAIGEKSPGIPAFALNATSSSNLPVSYSLISGPATLLANQLTITGIGNVSITATQVGDTNYLPATAVNQVFCVRVSELTNITGALFVCPGQTATYKINRVAGLTYNWRLSNGTTFPSTNDSVVISWGGAGSYTLIVSATGPCGAASANDSLVVNVVTAVTPDAVTNMLPANGSGGQQLPLTLSWMPANNALTYDLYVWDSASTQPSVPFASNITGISYQLPSGSFSYNKSFKWRIVSKNACLQADGPVQTFRLRPLPDLIVSNVQLPATATSGQTISLSWRVTNNGPGNTTTNQSWSDAVFLSFDTIPNFNITPNTNPAAWSQLEFPVRPLLVTTKPNVSALDSGQHYDNSTTFTLPLNYAQPLYLYVVTNFPNNPNAPLQMSYANDTARAPQPVTVTLAPTPDLRVDTIFTPASVFSGSTVNITYKIKNYGVLTPAGKTWVDKIYLSQTPTFNINTAIQLNYPKANGSYYPNATPVAITHDTQLLGDSSYTSSIQAVIPNFISGTYYVFVLTNQTGTLYEGLLQGNNSNKTAVQVFLTPTPLLTVNTLNVPFTQASITQPIGVNWTIRNNGFADNLEKNKGHYYKQSGNCDALNIKLVDSIGFGSSYWLDRVYLSTDPNGINGNAVLVGSFTQGVYNSGMLADLAPAQKCVPAGSNVQLYNDNTSNVISPSSSHPGQLNFTVPDNLLPGNYYVYVLTNATQTVFEYPGSAQVKRSDLPIVIQRPDISVTGVTVPGTSTGGQPFTINYSLLNNGAGAVYSHQRKDRIYVSSSATFDGSAQLITTLNFAEALPVGVTVSHSFDYTFPTSTSGTKYIYVQTNYDSSFRESAYANNIGSATINVSAATPVDWVIPSVNIADTVFTLYSTTIKYQVNNNGAGNASGTWIDSVYISCNPVFNNSTAYFVTTRTQSTTVNSGAAYTDSFVVNLPLSWMFNNCFPQTTYNTAYFFVKANANNAIFEGANGNNNITGSGAKVLVNPLVDHIVTTVTGADTATVARPYNVGWTVKNIGMRPTDGPYLNWFDGIYFSPDSVLNANAILATNILKDTRLNANQVYSDLKPVIPPAMPTGEYYLIVKTNSLHQITAEKVLNNNTNLLRDALGNPKKVYVIQPLLPDLTDSIVTSPAVGAVGQPITVVHKVANRGSGATYPGSWSNNLWLSQDYIAGNAGDIQLSSQNSVGVLNAGESKTDTVIAYIPLTVPSGNYILISKADAANNIVELADTNNLAFASINIYTPAPSDLIVESIIRPDTVTLGYNSGVIQWDVVNNSSNNATGFSADGIYLSKNNTLDSSAMLMGVLNKTINISPLGRKSETLQPMITGVTEGNYNLLVKADLLNNIIESDKNNNTGIAASKVYVKVKELRLGVPEQNTLQSIGRYYKLVIPDSLRGSTILVTLKSNDSLTMLNEIYIAAGYVPTPAANDYRFEIPNYGNQQIVIANVEDTVYYLYARCVSQSPVLQNITLNAVKLPFAVLMVQSNSGGNSGNVTVKINGSLFVPGMIAKLSNGTSTIYSSAIYFTNSTSLYATFNLKGKALGLYDMTLQKPDSSMATLAGSFTIVPPNNGGLAGGINTGSTGNGNDPGCDPGAPAGYNSQLLTEVVIPKKVFAGWPFVIQVHFSNPTNTDLPAQVRIIYCDYNVPIALTEAGLNNAKSSLYLEISEPGGPPGIIRAGATGTITLHAKAPVSTPGHTFINFILK